MAEEEWIWKDSRRCEGTARHRAQPRQSWQEARHSWQDSTRAQKDAKAQPGYRGHSEWDAGRRAHVWVSDSRPFTNKELMTDKLVQAEDRARQNALREQAEQESQTKRRVDRQHVHSDQSHKVERGHCYQVRNTALVYKGAAQFQ